MYDTVATYFLVYDDLQISANSGAPEVRACASSLEIADSDDDVVNAVTMTYTPEVGGTPILVVRENVSSIAEYGYRGYQRSDLTPKLGVPVLAPLGDRLVHGGGTARRPSPKR